MKRFPLALRFLWRESRSGELTILALALILAVTSTSAIALFSDRLQQTMTSQTAEFLAADLVIASADLIPNAWADKARALQLEQARTAEFSSVLVENDELMLISVKAVSDAYPLRGHLKVTSSDYLHERTVTTGPKPGFVWLEQRILSALKLKLGDQISVGEKKLTLAEIITFESDKPGNFYSFSPQIMINQADLQATGLIQPGSHVHYFFQYRGKPEALAQLKQWLKPQLNPSQRIMDIYQDRPELGSALTRIKRYLGLSSVLVIVISGVAIAMATRRFSERHFNAAALLRCLGMQQKSLLWLFTNQFLILGLLCSIIGCLFGWFLQQALFELLRDLLPAQIAKPGWLGVLFGVLTGLTSLLTFALPPLLQLQRVSALRVLRRELAPLATRDWLTYGLALVFLTALVMHYANDFDTSVSILSVSALTFIALSIIVYGLLYLTEKTLPELGLSWRSGLKSLVSNKKNTLSQILAFSTTLAAITLSFTVRNDLLNDWQKHLPDQAANHFVLNIFPDQRESFQQDLLLNGIHSNSFYPIVRGRLVAVNNTPVQRRVSKNTPGENATHRELSLTWSQELPADNKIIAGHWWPSLQKHQVSIEEKLAESLKIHLHDQLTFTVGSQSFSATVTSIRALDWATMRPNFYMIFSPGSLDSYPNTFITSFYLAEAKKNSLNALVKKYPAVTILEADAIIKQLKTLLNQLTKAIDYLLYFSLLSGFCVLAAAVYCTLDQRIHENAVMRALGAKRTLLMKMQLMEFGALGLIAGALAVILTELVTYRLYEHVLRLDYRPAYVYWLLLPALGTFWVCFVGYLGAKRVVYKPPVSLLREL
jgi:putative ABC transport system permease protein